MSDAQSYRYPYAYPVGNTDLIASHALIKHFEGGYYAQTAGVDSYLPLSSTSSSEGSATLVLGIPKSAALGEREQIASGPAAELLQGPPQGNAQQEAQGHAQGHTQGTDKRSDATQIYYLLTSDSYRGRMHMNLHSTFHLHHAGRALYTLIKPPSPSSSSSAEAPTIHRVILGSDVRSGEVTQLFVPGGWWKASEIPEEDLLLLDSPAAQGPDVGLKEKIGCLISEVVVPGWNPDQHQFIDEDKLKAMWGGQPGWEQYTKYIQAPEGLEYPDK